MKNPIKQFESFLKEATQEKKYKILVISSEPKESKMFHTAESFVKEGKAEGHKVYIVKVENAYIRFEDGAYYVHNVGDEKGFEISASDTVAFVRGSVRLKKSWLDILSQLEKIGVCMVNSRETVELTSDKYRTYLKLMDFGLTQPKTVLIPNKDGVEEALKTLDTEFPIIMKTLEGSKGIGVLFVESERSLTSLVQLLFAQDEDTDLLIQEFKKTEYDVRVIVLGGKVIASMERGVVKGDFRSNVSQGAEVKEFNLTELEVEQSLLAAKAVDGAWAAVDFIPSENREKEPPFILEVNHSPGTDGIEKASAMNVVKTVIDYYADPDNRYSVPSQCGYYEILDVKPFGPLVAKFDTGNSVHNVLHAEDIKVLGKKISFTLNGKRISTRLRGSYTSITGGGEDERYIVKLDCSFGGTDYKDIAFGLDDRSRMGTEVLLDRDLMTTFNVVVNPNRKYVLTTKFIPKED